MRKTTLLAVGLLATVFSLGCSQASGHAEEYKAGDDVLPALTFNAEGEIRVEKKKTLDLTASSGWTWALLPAEIDIARLSRMTLSVRTSTKCVVYLELKDKKGDRENPLVGKESANNVWKVQVELPNTSGAFQDVVLDLDEHFRPDLKERQAKVIVFSDPDADMAIQSIRFDRKPK